MQLNLIKTVYKYRVIPTTIIYYVYNTLYTVYCTMYNVHCILQSTVNCTPRTSQSTPYVQADLHTALAYK